MRFFSAVLNAKENLKNLYVLGRYSQLPSSPELDLRSMAPVEEFLFFQAIFSYEILKKN